jgi:putative FmdB family regulatory protein
MPVYEYVCLSCQHPFERYVKTWGEAVTCPLCAGDRVEKQLSTFAMAGAAGPGPSSGGGGGCCGGGCGCR